MVMPADEVNVSDLGVVTKDFSPSLSSADGRFIEAAVAYRALFTPAVSAMPNRYVKRRPTMPRCCTRAVM
jgi:hypothetical protein